MSDAASRLAKSIELPLGDFDRAIVDLVPKLPGPAKWRAFNAVRHLDWAWKLRTVDPEMAAFRAITAEEEAATAIFVALRRRGYEDADKLRPRDHVHKNAVIPFFDAITRVIAAHGAQLPGAQLYLKTEEDPPLLTFRFRQPHPLTGEEVWAYPQPPLNVSVTSGPVGELKRDEDFTAGVKEIVQAAKVKDIMTYLRNRANERNRVLYAADNGFPSMTGDIEKGLRSYQRNVFTLLRIYLLIDQYERKQLFVQQALTAFLRTLKMLPAIDDAIA